MSEHTEEHPAQETRPRRYKPGTVPMVILAIYALLLIASEILPHYQEEAEKVGELFAYSMFSVLVVYAVAWFLSSIVWYASRRSKMAADAMFSLLIVGLVASGFLVSYMRASRGEESWQNFEQQTDQALRRLNEAHDENGLLPSPRTALAEATRSMEFAAEQLSGEQAILARSELAAMSSLQALMARNAETYSKFIKLGAIGPATMNTQQAVQERSEIASSLIEINNELSDAFKNAPKRFEKALRKEGLAPGKIPKAVAGFIQGSQLEVLLQMYEAQDDMLEAVIHITQILDREWGRWHVTDDGVGIYFDDSDVGPKYNEFIAQINAALARVSELSRKIKTDLSYANGTSP